MNSKPIELLSETPETRTQHALYVPKGENRFKEALKIWGMIPLQIKISSKDTAGGALRL